MLFNQVSLAAILAMLVTSSGAASSDDLHLNITAITAKARSSIFECWELEPAIQRSSQAAVGFSLPFSDLANMTYSVAGPHFDSGLHFAPAAQWLVLLGGQGVIALPDDPSAELVINSTETGFLFAMDTSDISDKGHYSWYPGDTNSVFLQIPTVDGKVPEHTVLHSGPCEGEDYATLKTLG